jgi:nicotinamide-nucleotide amidase
MHALKTLLLQKPALTIAAAESLTCGHVQALLGSVSGSSAYFLGGLTAYTLAQKVEHLGVDRAEARRVNSVSAAVAEQMARGACTLFGSDLGVATTGYAEPDSIHNVTDPFAWWAVAHRRGRRYLVRSGRIECPGEKRREVQTLVAAAVIAELTSYLEEFRRAR